MCNFAFLLTNRTLFIFPLQLVGIEFEEIRLHIFEPRYKRLIKHCYESGETFGIPTVIQSKLTGFGAEVKLVGIEKTHENGEMDIVCKVVGRFELLEVFKAREEGLAATALIKPFGFSDNTDKELHLRVFDLLNEFYHIADAPIPKDFEKAQDMFKFVHKCGLSIPSG